MITHSAEILQTFLSHTCDLYQKMTLKINVSKTEDLQYNPTSSPSTSTTSAYGIYLQRTTLSNVDSLKYLDSHISHICQRDEEINYWIMQVSRAYGKLNSRISTTKTLLSEERSWSTMRLHCLHFST